jgi:hypothetical protein
LIEKERGLPTTTASAIDAVIQTVIAEAQFTEQHRNVMANLVRKYTIGKGEGDSVDIPKFGTVTAQALTEGVDMANPQQLTTSKVTITPGEVGAQIILTDKAVRAANTDLLRAAGRVLGNAMAKKQGQDLLGLLDGFSQSLPGAGTSPTLAHLRAARSRLHGATEPAPMKHFAVLHPYQWDAIAADLSPTGTYPVPDGMSESVIRDYWVGRVLGMDVFVDGNITVDGSDDAKGGVFSKESMVLVTMKKWSVERERDASLRAWELNVVADYGYAEYEDSWGVEFYSDASTPTG